MWYTIKLFKNIFISLKHILYSNTPEQDLKVVSPRIMELPDTRLEAILKITVLKQGPVLE